MKARLHAEAPCKVSVQESMTCNKEEEKEGSLEHQLQNLVIYMYIYICMYMCIYIYIYHNTLPSPHTLGTCEP